MRMTTNQEPLSGPQWAEIALRGAWRRRICKETNQAVYARRGRSGAVSVVCCYNAALYVPIFDHEVEEDLPSGLMSLAEVVICQTTGRSPTVAYATYWPNVKLLDHPDEDPDLCPMVCTEPILEYIEKQIRMTVGGFPRMRAFCADYLALAENSDLENSTFFSEQG